MIPLCNGWLNGNNDKSYKKLVMNLGISSKNASNKSFRHARSIHLDFLQQDQKQVVYPNDTFH